VLFYI